MKKDEAYQLTLSYYLYINTSMFIYWLTSSSEVWQIIFFSQLIAPWVDMWLHSNTL
jgi:hypothetical protein